MARNWRSSISDDLLGRLGRSDQPFQGFQGSASDLAAGRPPPAAPPRSTGIFIPTAERLDTDDTPVISHTRFGR